MKREKSGLRQLDIFFNLIPLLILTISIRGAFYESDKT
jgi:hypothetical protein